MLSIKAQMDILNLCKGMSLKSAIYRLELMEKYACQKQCELRVKLNGLNIGD